MESGRPVRNFAVILVREDNGPDQVMRMRSDENRRFWICFEGRVLEGRLGYGRVMAQSEMALRILAWRW